MLDTSFETQDGKLPNTSEVAKNMTPMPKATSKADFGVKSADKPKQRRNIMGRGGNTSVLNPKLKLNRKDVEEESKILIMGDKAIKENHLLRSIYKLKQQDDKSAASRIGVGDGKTENFARMTTQLTHARSKFGVRSVNPRGDSKEQKRMNQLYPKLSKPEVHGNLKSQFGGVTPQTLLATHNGENWMKKRNTLSKTETNRRHIEFAKYLFQKQDGDGTKIDKT